MIDSQPSEHIVIDADVTASALVEARMRILRPDEFRREELAWLKTHSPLGHVAITEMFGYEMGRSDDESYAAEPAMQGALCGSYVVRRLAEEDQVDYGIVVANHRDNFGGGKKLRHARDLSPDEIKAIFGNNAGGVLANIINSVARTMCSVLIITSLSKHEAGTGTFIQPAVARRSATRRRASGSGPR
ncbi:MAG: hypothetical protein V4702_01655 [Patescibacteria group bacterium]